MKCATKEEKELFQEIPHDPLKTFPYARAGHPCKLVFQQDTFTASVGQTN